MFKINIICNKESMTICIEEMTLMTYISTFHVTMLSVRLIMTTDQSYSGIV